MISDGVSVSFLPTDISTTGKADERQCADAAEKKTKHNINDTFKFQKRLCDMLYGLKLL